jgi:uncharacterized protein YbjT (DUF2867 family)
MLVVIAGGHGQIARLLGRELVARGNQVRGLIRNPDHVADLEGIGVAASVTDLEAESPRLEEPLAGADAVVFAAGAGPGSGPDRKWSVDRDGALRLIEACQSAGVRRYVMVSAMGAREGARGQTGDFAAYIEAKAQADRALADSGLDYTIMRPGRLTDEPAMEHIAAAPELPRNSIPRADVALTLVAVLESPNTVGKDFDLTTGPLPFQAAVAAL